MTNLEGLIKEFDKKYSVSKDDDLITTTRYALLNDLKKAHSLGIAKGREEAKSEFSNIAKRDDSYQNTAKRPKLL